MANKIEPIKIDLRCNVVDLLKIIDKYKSVELKSNEDVLVDECKQELIKFIDSDQFLISKGRNLLNELTRERPSYAD